MRTRLAICIALLLLPAAAFAAAPQRIVSLKPSITDTIVALGLGGRLVGITRYCELPDGMKRPEVVADYTRPFAERIIALTPELVLGSQENSSRRSIENLQRAGIAVKLYPFTDLKETLASIRAIAEDLGEPAAGEALATKVERSIAALATRYASATPTRVVAVWGTRPLVVAGPGTYLDELLAKVGARNAVTGTRIRYPRIGLEELIALDPDAILDLSMGSESAEGAARERPWDGVAELSAVRKGRVVRLDTDLFRAGPRLPEGLAKLGEMLHASPITDPRSRMTDHRSLIPDPKPQ